MEAVLEWMKGIVVLFIVLAALLYLLPNPRYKRYVQFFLEMVVVIAVISPVSKVIYASEDFEEKIHYSQFWTEMENLQKDAEKMEFVQSDYYRAEYETAIGEDVRQMASGDKFEVSQAEVTLSETYELERVTLVMKERGQEEGIQVEEIGAAAQLAESVEQETEFEKIRQKLKDFYHLEDSDIVITCK